MSEQQNISAEEAFYVGNWRVDPTDGRISRQGVEHKIEPKAMTVLVCLARQQGQVVSREALEEQAWAGMVVGYDSLAGAIIKLRKAFGDDSKNPRYIETIPKKGYRLICSVQTELVEPAGKPEAEAEGRPSERAAQAFTKPAMVAGEQPVIFDQPPTPDTKPVIKPAAQKMTVELRAVKMPAVFLLTVIAIAAVFYFKDEVPIPGPNSSQSTTQTSAKHSAGKLVIAVLPFKNLSDDVQQDYFSDGITADLITDLSKISSLSVIARNSVFIYKNTDVDIREVKQELGVDYVVEGSVRKVGDKVRISARLIDASSSINIWADRFDGSLDNLFAFQDSVTTKIINSLEVTLTEKDRTRLAQKYSNSIEAYDEFLRGWQDLWLSSREGMHRARGHFLKAIELDDKFARAYGNLALTYIYDHYLGWSDDDAEALVKAHEYADKAIEIDPELPQVYWVKSFADIFARDYQQSLKHAQHAIDLDPSFADGYGLLATTLNYAGNPKEADKMMRKAMQLNPKYPAIYNVIHGEIYFNMHDYKKAIENFSQALDVNPEIEESRIWLAAAYANIGDIDEASWQLEQIRMSGGNLSLQRIESVIPFKDPGQRKSFIDSLYRAGLKK
jgi:TolB-like protein/DNA-binding winged helix-turn-helix (wHTH) protein/Flp pilus assembly protein TadD